MGVRSPYKEYYDEDGLNSLTLPLEKSQFDSLPASVEWNGKKLLKKDEFHVTLLHVRSVCGSSKYTPEEVVTFFNEFTGRYPFKLLSLLDCRSVTQDMKQSIIVRSRVSNVERFFAALNHTFGIHMPTQPTHITLYTLQKNVGIHVPNDSVMDALPIVRIPELTEALKNIRVNSVRRI